MPESVSNEEQIAYWNEKAGPKWVAFQERLDEQIAQFMQVVLDRAALQKGERVLDIGCGCGALALAAGERVGATGQVTGVDISRPMLQRATERAREAGLNQVSFLEADAQTYAFGAGEYDAAVSRFGVMFFADSVAAFENIRRALKPGGRLVFICWRSVAENPWRTLPVEAAAQHIALPPPGDPNAPGPFALADAARLRESLESAGFVDVQIDPEDRPMKFGSTGTLEQTLEFMMDFGPVTPLLMDQPEAVVEAVRASTRAALAPYVGPEGVSIDSASWLVSARNS